jgi:hypothetical protein
MLSIITILNAPEDGTSPDGKVSVNTPSWPVDNVVAEAPLTVIDDAVAA